MAIYKDGNLMIGNDGEKLAKAINNQSHWLKTIAFNLAKIDQDLSGKHPYKLHIKRGKRRWKFNTQRIGRK